ncbi:MAG: 50S ribosomal protein L24 [Candidatus Brocadiaceae bacterium]|nr:50S ribosomal protein L24 [Candidatus Brocadiaceae bacterium]
MAGIQNKLHVRRGDTVEIITGSGRGMRGRVLRTLPAEGKVVVEGANMVWKHLRRSQDRPRGGRIQVEAPVHASNVALVCPHRECVRFDRPVRTRTLVKEDGKKVRLCSKCGTELPKLE